MILYHQISPARSETRSLIENSLSALSTRSLEMVVIVVMSSYTFALLSWCSRTPRDELRTLHCRVAPRPHHNTEASLTWRDCKIVNKRIPKQTEGPLQFYGLESWWVSVNG